MGADFNTLRRHCLINLIFSILLFTLGCNNNPTKPQDIRNYPGLKVGNTWTYFNYNYSYHTVDSSFLFVTVIGHDDSLWFISIKDSMFFDGYTDMTNRDSMPIVSNYCDTCIQSNGSINCKIFWPYFFKNILDSTEIKTINYNDSVITYYKASYRYETNLFYLNDIGLCKVGYYHRGATDGAIQNITLIEFNGTAVPFIDLIPFF